MVVLYAHSIHVMLYIVKQFAKLYYVENRRQHRAKITFPLCVRKSEELESINGVFNYMTNHSSKANQLYFNFRSNNYSTL